MSEQTPGWYADPRGATGTWRWWDGAIWTGWLSRDPNASPPSSRAAAPPQQAPPQQAPPQAPSGARVPLPAAVLAVIAAVLLGVVVIGLVVRVSEPRLPTGPAAAPPAPQPRVAQVAYSGLTRTAEVDEVRLTMPATPYVCDSGPGARPPAFTSLLSCTLVVHQDYNAQGDDAGSLVGFGVPEPSMVVAGDLPATAKRVFDRLHTAFFFGKQTTVEKVRTQSLDLGGTRAASVYGNVSYDFDGLPSTYDRLLVVVIPLDRGGYVVAYSDRPDDLPADTLAVLNRSLDSLATR